MQCWQVSASTGLNLGLNRPGRNRFLPEFLILSQFLSKNVGAIKFCYPV